ncbi:MAG: CDP-alcohol phosphatidyltransferase family protein [Myxococcota bacterium]|nr:CDP-alcohol phosphatidyltransferase family protein [Myxococcota bacterium]
MNTTSDAAAPGQGLADYFRDLPNGVTFCGLLVGLGALSFVARERFGTALALALLAVLVDQLDGRLALARPQRSAAVRAFGAHLDCYADFVSKGVFPALMLLLVGDFGLAFWVVGAVHLVSIATRYSYEFVPDAPRRGLSPDYSILTFGLLYLSASALGSLYPGVLAGAMLGLCALNLAPLSPPKVKGAGLLLFCAIAGVEIFLLLGGP